VALFVLGIAGRAVNDRVEACGPLVVLNGDHPARAHEAARLFREGVGREVWLTSDPHSSDSHGDAGTRSNATTLTADGVPSTAIHTIPGAARGTRAEIAAVAEELRRQDVPCAIVVTSPVHARRVRVTWQRVVGASPRAVIRHAPGAAYAGWYAQARELGATFFAWIGLPR
jgi:uncharacterized SAM-binding protein YcdF (DUF218 family)